MKATIVFVRDEDKGTTSLLVDDVEMGRWIDKQPPAWAYKLMEIIAQRVSIQKLVNRPTVSTER